MSLRHLIVAPALALAVASGCASRDTKDPTPPKQEAIPVADMRSVRVDGTVVATGPSAFELDYGGGIITVEMDDWDWYAEGRNLMLNDKVTVYGRVDNDLFESRTIEAGAVFVESLGTYFYASPADEEAYGLVGATHIQPGFVYLEGTVDSIDGREFWLDTGTRKIEVDTASMMYDPLDDEGSHQVTKGDEVRVYGRLDNDLFDNLELAATNVISVDT